MWRQKFLQEDKSAEKVFEYKLEVADNVFPPLCSQERWILYISLFSAWKINWQPHFPFENRGFQSFPDLISVFFENFLSSLFKVTMFITKSSDEKDRGNACRRYLVGPVTIVGTCGIIEKQDNLSIENEGLKGWQKDQIVTRIFILKVVPN